jgi:methylenetetrahydrofolate reductase (NADPH)
LINPDKPGPCSITDAYSLEVSAKDIAALTAAAPRMVPAATISIPYRHREDDDARLAAARAVRRLGFEPMPHFLRRVSLARRASIVRQARGR